MSRPPPRVLVAEDHDINAQFLVLLLQRIGLQADIARDGTEALAMTQVQPYAAVLMDLYMPGLNGVEATRAIRALPAPACHTPVVLVTAESEEDIEGLTPELRFAAIAAKPLRDEALRRALVAGARRRCFGHGGRGTVSARGQPDAARIARRVAQ